MLTIGLALVVTDECGLKLLLLRNIVLWLIAYIGFIGTLTSFYQRPQTSGTAR